MDWSLLDRPANFVITRKARPRRPSPGDAGSSGRGATTFKVIPQRHPAGSVGQATHRPACEHPERTLLDSWITRSATITDLARLFD